MDKKTYAIGILSLSAIILFVANMLAPRGVIAANTIKDNDYQLQTARIQQGGEALYVTDNRTGMMAAFVFNPNRRTVEPVDSKPIMEAFSRGVAGGKK